MTIRKEDILAAVQSIREDEMPVTYGAIARRLPKSPSTGKPYTREFIRQKLKTFAEGRIIYATMMRTNLIKSKSKQPPLVLVEFEDWFPGQEGERIRIMDATPQIVYGRIVYGMLPLELAVLAQYCVGKDDTNQICEYRVTKTNGFKSED